MSPDAAVRGCHDDHRGDRRGGRASHLCGARAAAGSHQAPPLRGHALCSAGRRTAAAAWRGPSRDPPLGTTVGVLCKHHKHIRCGFTKAGRSKHL